jgi:hypothetical protein
MAITRLGMLGPFSAGPFTAKAAGPTGPGAGTLLPIMGAG